MLASGALPLLLALVSGTGDDRLLLCRPTVAGDASLARADAVLDAARGLGERFLDYGVACEGPDEGARAARRAGLGHAVVTSAEGRAAGSRYVLVLTDASTERTRAQRAVEVAPGQDAARPLRVAFDGLVDALPPGPGPRPAHVAAWSVAGAGAAALAAGIAFGVMAGDDADRVDAARTPAAYTRARADYDRSRKWRNATLGAGGALLAAGLTWRFAF